MAAAMMAVRAWVSRVVWVSVIVQLYTKEPRARHGLKNLTHDTLAALAAILVSVRYRPDLAALHVRNVIHGSDVEHILWNHYDAGRANYPIA